MNLGVVSKGSMKTRYAAPSVTEQGVLTPDATLLRLYTFQHLCSNLRTATKVITMQLLSGLAQVAATNVGHFA